MKLTTVFLSLLLVLPTAAVLSGADTLDIYYIDVEGGKAMIVQNPSGQSMLIDGGMPGRGEVNRDLMRVKAAAEALGIKQFDVTLVTHYDVDHSGNIPHIGAEYPLGLLVDHGALLPNPKLGAGNRAAADAYLEFLRGKKRLVVKPGDIIPFEDVKITVLTSNEEVLSQPLPGAGQPNTACPATLPEPMRGDDNASSIGTLWEFGDFRMADFGDLLQWAEMKLMCPNNPVGTVDLFMVNHHGLALSNSAALVHALQPKASIMNNGDRKGGAQEVTEVLRSSPGFQDSWQLHFATRAGEEFNAPENFIANMTPGQECEGHWIKVSASRDGSFTITNTRNSFSKTYTH